VGTPPGPLPDLGSGPPIAPRVPVELAPGVVRVSAPNPSMMTGPGTNTYLVGARSVTVIDPGPAGLPAHTDALVAAAGGAGAIDRIVVTHTHPDHAPGAAALAAATGAEVIGYGPAEGFEPDRLAAEGSRFAVGDDALLARHTPGHASDHLCWLLESSRLLFTGDHVMEGSTVVIRPPDGDMGDYLASLERLVDGSEQISAIAPGHGRVIAEPTAAVRAVLAHRRVREALVATVLSETGPATLEDLLDLVYGDVGPERTAVARASLWAHLRHLVATGEAECDRPITAEGTDEGGTWRPVR